MKIDLTKFQIPNIDSWKNQVLKEANSDEALMYTNHIENIRIDISSKNNQKVFASASTKGDWDVCSAFKIDDSFDNNEMILKCLEHGSNHIYLELVNKNPNWNKIFEDIFIEIIHVSISFHHPEQIETFKLFVKKENEKNFTVCIDTFDIGFYGYFKNSSVSFCINGFNLEQIGASTYQQIAQVLLCGERILQLCKSPERLKFKIGIGSNFLIEIAKIRALKWLWNHILSQNNYSQNEIYILGCTGWTNKSLKDPHTNLLRQTTEGLSAIIGGSSGLLTHSANELTSEGASWFDLRMSLNISHILKEESFISKVLDPMKGSYLIEMFTEQIIHNSWDLFLELHMNSENETNTLILDKIKETRKKKMEEFHTGNKELIGINLFQNQNEENRNWDHIPNYMEMNYLIFENLKLNG